MKIRLFPLIEHEIFHSSGSFLRSFAIGTLIYSLSGLFTGFYSLSGLSGSFTAFNLFNLTRLRGLTRFGSDDPFISREIHSMSWTAVIGSRTVAGYRVLPMASPGVHTNIKTAQLIQVNFPLKT
jgi:hypothetical protein